MTHCSEVVAEMRASCQNMFFFCATACLVVAALVPLPLLLKRRRLIDCNKLKGVEVKFRTLQISLPMAFAVADSALVAVAVSA